REAEPRREERPGLLSGLLEKLEPAAAKLKEMGLGYTLALADQLLTGALPEQWRGGGHDIGDQVAPGLGGRPVEEGAEHDGQDAGGGERSASYQTGPTTQF